MGWLWTRERSDLLQVSERTCWRQHVGGEDGELNEHRWTDSIRKHLIASYTSWWMHGEHREHLRLEIFKAPVPGLEAKRGCGATSSRFQWAPSDCSQWWQRKYIKCLNESNGIAVIKYHLYIFRIMVGALQSQPASPPVPVQLSSQSKFPPVPLEPRSRLCLHFHSNRVYRRFTTWLQKPLAPKLETWREQFGINIARKQFFYLNLRKTGYVIFQLFVLFMHK